MKDLTGYFKVAQSGGCFVVASFYNPKTKDLQTVRVRDYDYADCSRDRDELYYMEINKDVWRIWQHDNGNILKGDCAKVVKGRTIEHGFIGKVKDIREYHDKYGRWIADYLYFTDGRKINIKNCILV